jgi:hypothetical protein
MRTADANVARFSDWRANRDRRDRQVLKEGLAAAVDAVYEWTGRDQDVRVAIVAMYGDPHAGAEDGPEGGRGVPVEAQFISLDGARPLTDVQRRHLALETMRSASEPLYREITMGLALADLLEDLAEATEDGDAEAAADYSMIMKALRRHKNGGSDGDHQA